jgi:hypothetical protein
MPQGYCQSLFSFNLTVIKINNLKSRIKNVLVQSKSYLLIYL